MRRAATITFASLVSLGSVFAMSAAVGARAVPTRLATLQPSAATSSTFTLNLLGVPLVIDVTTDAGGNLVDVALNPTDPPFDFLATTLEPNKVVFVNTDGTVNVKVRAKHGAQRVGVRTASLADLGGPGSWVGDVFDGGDSTTVNFTVGELAGAPDVAVDSVLSPLVNVVGATKHDADDGDGAKASVSVEFVRLDQTRRLKIEVSVGEGDGTNEASVRISLSKIRGAQEVTGEAVGPHTWTGTLCDGQIATVDYIVADDGTVSVPTPPEGAEVTTREHGVRVRFATGERLEIRVRDADGTLTVGAKFKLRCEAPVPTVNTPVDTRENAHKGKHGDAGND